MTEQVEFKQLRLPLVQLAEAGRYMYMSGHVYCDYCSNDAVWLHFESGPKDRNYFACNEHVRWLNKRYAMDA